MAGDLITAIDDTSIKGLTLEAALGRISGPVNAAIKLKIIRQRQDDPLVVAFAREAVPSHSVQLQIRVADGKLVVEATGGWSILDFDKGQPTPVAARSKDEFQVESGDHTRIAFIATPPAKSTARFSIRDHGSNAAHSRNRALADLDPRVLHDLAPVRDLRLDMRTELFGRAAGRLRCDLRERLAHARLRQSPVDGLVQSCR